MFTKPKHLLLKGWVTEITIAASQQQVWNKLVDFEAYPQWNPFMLEAYATLQVGSILRFLKTLQGFGQHWIKAKFQVIQAFEVLFWQGHIYASFLFNVRHSSKLEAMSETHVIHSHEHRDFLVPFLADCGVFNRSYQGYIRFNKALKQWCEQCLINDIESQGENC